ncbi:MAG: flavin reductase family protein [Cyclonatronaceae bacterium]
MEINPENMTPQQCYKLLIGSVVPRPIAFVSTIDKNGTRNLAPFSFFNVVCYNPMTLAFFAQKFKKDGELKDTVKNIRANGEFVINISTENIAEQVNAASGIYDHDVDEFDITGLTAARSVVVKPPRVQESPVNFECRLDRMIEFGTEKGGSDAVFGRVVHLHINDDLIDDYRIDIRKLKPIARLAGNSYSKIGEIFDIERPVV